MLGLEVEALSVSMAPLHVNAVVAFLQQDQGEFLTACSGHYTWIIWESFRVPWHITPTMKNQMEKRVEYERGSGIYIGYIYIYIFICL